ncbi:hypothetical protein [Salinispora mooreana]|uniref:hypothetical protein n=1 Tax=Salinispora mooreana TaxID=999545 RepID=UPI0013A5A566|nr:hypothetical protein [Salinispora mooreana]
MSRRQAFRMFRMRLALSRVLLQRLALTMMSLLCLLAQRHSTRQATHIRDDI